MVPLNGADSVLYFTCKTHKAEQIKRAVVRLAKDVQVLAIIILQLEIGLKEHWSFTAEMWCGADHVKRLKTFFCLCFWRADCEICINHSYPIKIELWFTFWEFRQITIPKYTFCPASTPQLSVFFTLFHPFQYDLHIIFESSALCNSHFLALSFLSSFQITVKTYFFTSECLSLFLW